MGGGGTRSIMGIFWGAVSDHGELAKPAHQKQKAHETSLGIKDQSCPMLRLSHKAMR